MGVYSHREEARSAAVLCNVFFAFVVFSGEHVWRNNPACFLERGWEKSDAGLCVN